MLNHWTELPGSALGYDPKLCLASSGYLSPNIRKCDFKRIDLIGGPDRLFNFIAPLLELSNPPTAPLVTHERTDIMQSHITLRLIVVKISSYHRAGSPT
jgi:hypothetical protein